MVIRTILNQLPLSPQQVDKIKQELTPTSQNLNDNIKYIQSQMKNRGILEDIEPLEINFVNVECQTYSEKEKTSHSNTSRPYSNNEFEDYESMEENQSNDGNKCKNSNCGIFDNENANKSNPEIPPIEIYSDPESIAKKDYSSSSRFPSPEKTYNNDNEYYEYRDFYTKKLESTKKNQSRFPESQRCYQNDESQRNEKCAIHNQNSSFPQTAHSRYHNNSEKEIRHHYKRRSLTSKERGKYVVNSNNCAPHFPTRKEAKGDSKAINNYDCSSNESEYAHQQTAFEYYEVSSNETTTQEFPNKRGCCSSVNNMLRSIFSFNSTK